MRLRAVRVALCLRARVCALLRALGFRGGVVVWIASAERAGLHHIAQALLGSLSALPLLLGGFDLACRGTWPAGCSSQ